MPHIPDPIIYAVIVGSISALGVVVASHFASKAARANANTALAGVSHQIDYQIAAKLSEFRQSWINQLRECMAEIQSYGVTPEIDHARTREFYKFGTRIELLMNRTDERYERLQQCMYCFLSASTPEEKFACNAPFVAVCQDILKTEWDVLKSDLQKSNRVRPTVDSEISK